MYDTLPYLPFKIYQTPIEINNNFISNNMGNATYIIMVARRKADIALLKLGKIIKDDELNFSFKVSIQVILKPAELFGSIFGSVNSKFFTIQIKIGIEAVEFIVGPEKLFVLHPAPAKLHLVPIVKLGLRGYGKNEGHQHKRCRQPKYRETKPV